MDYDYSMKTSFSIYQQLNLFLQVTVRKDSLVVHAPAWNSNAAKDKKIQKKKQYSPYTDPPLAD